MNNPQDRSEPETQPTGQPAGDAAEQPSAQNPQGADTGSVFAAEDAPTTGSGGADTPAEGLEGGEAEEAPEVAEAEAIDPAKLVEQAQSERQKAVDEALRARAEMDNVRKRAARDADNARKFALEKLMTDMIDVIESLERGLLAAEGEQVSIEQMKEGTELTFKMLNKVLAKHGLEEVVPDGQPFDPERHEALSMIPTAECEPDSVVQVVQKGFVLNGRLLRPARVLVAQAPPEG
ncbi:MAG: nucleotide exchange factor GrpE [Pseudomonadota bacterium]